VLSPSHHRDPERCCLRRHVSASLNTFDPIVALIASAGSFASISVKGSAAKMLIRRPDGTL
jgi:hypothetical protein